HEAFLKIKDQINEQDFNAIISAFRPYISSTNRSTDLNAELFEKGTYDVTGLRAKGFFHEELNKFLPRSKENLAMLIFDIDHFKKLNDNVDHNYGDIALYKIAQKSQDILLDTIVDDEEPFIARYGGEEIFAAILNYKKDETDLYNRAELLRKGIETLYLPESDMDIPKKFSHRSITIAGKIYDPSDISIVAFRDKIDKELVQAKRHKRRNTVSIIPRKEYQKG
ncbi:GGDEF domain-containing protein, partial [Candidatus Woesearchaeota archaeon]|nr:GGDEF domain-containing protein [Candidatus Woesearchaeota archaeon]